MKKFKILWELPKYETQYRDTKWASTVGKTVLTDLLDAGLPQNVNSQINLSAKCTKAEHNKTKYACGIHWVSLVVLWKNTNHLWT